MIPVTKPFLPPREEYDRYLEGIWKRNYLTNNGPLVNEFELRLKEYLEIKHLLYLSNGTIALQLAIKALDLKGEIITTPFSYVATTSSIVWEGCTPVFVDIESRSYNIDPTKIEHAVTSNTSAILATHCFGNPCKIDQIQEIADRHRLKVIYDAAHCFGTKYKGRSVFDFGDVSTTSFHSTKLFHTVEGGAVFTKDPELLKKMAYMRNFGHDGPERFFGLGINAKNSEFHAAMGLVNLNYVDDVLVSRKRQVEYYQEILRGLNVQFIELLEPLDYNYSYCPIIFESESLLKRMKHELEINEIFPRRYFYPSLTELNYVQGNSPVSEDISSRVLCLPLYFDLAEEEQDMIARLLLRVQNN